MRRATRCGISREMHSRQSGYRGLRHSAFSIRCSKSNSLMRPSRDAIRTLSQRAVLSHTSHRCGMPADHTAVAGKRPPVSAAASAKLSPLVMNHGLFRGPIDPVMLCPAVGHNEERRRRIALPADGLARLQHHCRSRRNNVLNRSRFESAEYDNAGDDLQVTG